MGEVDFGFWTLDFGLWTLDFEICSLGSEICGHALLIPHFANRI